MRKPLFFCMAILSIAVMLLLVSGSSRRTLPARPLYQLEGAGNTVFITFNVAWDVEEELAAILSYLQAQKMEAVFFVTGDWLKEFPQSAVSILEHGQQLGNRTLSHRRLMLMTEAEIAGEIKDFNKLCRELPGFAYTPSFFRPPHGEYNSRIVRLAREAGCLTLLWSINARTMAKSDPEFIINHLEERLHPGAVILFHLSPGVASSLPPVVEFLQWKGYTIGSPRLLLR